MALPPAPANASMRMVLAAGAVATWSAIFLYQESERVCAAVFRIMILRHGFWSDAKPGIVGQPDTVVVAGEDVVALVPVLGDVVGHIFR